jgi:urea transport system ATP-binding protein
MLLIESLSVAYGESLVLSGVNLEVPAGQVVCLMGRNGVGKTTLLKSIMGLLRPRAGRVCFLDQDVTAWPTYKRARAGIGYVPQGRDIFPYLTVHENLLMGLEAIPAGQRRPEAVQKMYDLFPALKVNPRKAAGTLSGGQQQQLALARSLVRQPRLLLLDEPTEGLQPTIVQEIEELLQGVRQQRDTSILLVEQFLDFALSVADYCYVMEKGAIVLEGPTNNLDQNMVREYLAV